MLIPLRTATLEQLSPTEFDTLLGNARLLQQRAARLQSTPLRGKKLALLCDSEEGAEARLFRKAASDLGAHVSHIRPQFSDLRGPDDLHQTAQLLGRLYDAVECQGLAPALVEVFKRASGVPVYDGLASADHPTAAIASLLSAAGSADLRRLVVQTCLVSTLL